MRLVVYRQAVYFVCRLVYQLQYQAQYQLCLLPVYLLTRLVLCPLVNLPAHRPSPSSAQTTLVTRWGLDVHVGNDLERLERYNGQLHIIHEGTSDEWKT